MPAVRNLNGPFFAMEILMSKPSGTSLEPTTSGWQGVRSALLLTFPVWAVVLLLALLSLSPDGSQTPGEPLIFFGLLAPFVGAAPIFRMPTPGIAGKAMLFIVYYVICAVTMFVVGWASLGIFGLAR